VVLLLGVRLADRRPPRPALIPAVNRAERALSFAAFLGRIAVLKLGVAVYFVQQQDQVSLGSIKRLELQPGTLTANR
jgi:hypothetical protein